MEGVVEGLVNNGLPGIIIAALGWVVIHLYKKQDKRQQQLEDDLRDMRKKLDGYLDDDRVEMLKTIKNNTDACHKLHSIITDVIK